MAARDEGRGGHRPPRPGHTARPSVRRARPVLAGLACLIASLACVPAASAAPSAVAPEQEIVTLVGAQAVRDRPTIAGRILATVAATRPITRGPTVLPALSQTVDSRGRTWLRVRLPGRVLGLRPPPPEGWILASGTRRSITPWHIVVDVGARRVLVYREGRRVRSESAIVGARATPTPRGEFFIEESVRLGPTRSGAPFALALSARSAVLQEFAGGPGQIALHGLVHVGGVLGTAVSHGCVRLSNSSITWLAARMLPGVPVTVV